MSWPRIGRRTSATRRRRLGRPALPRRDHGPIRRPARPRPPGGTRPAAVPPAPRHSTSPCPSPFSASRPFPSGLRPRPPGAMGGPDRPRAGSCPGQGRRVPRPHPLRADWPTVPQPFEGLLGLDAETVAKANTRGGAASAVLGAAVMAGFTGSAGLAPGSARASRRTALEPSTSSMQLCRCLARTRTWGSWSMLEWPPGTSKARTPLLALRPQPIKGSL